MKSRTRWSTATLSLLLVGTGLFFNDVNAAANYKIGSKFSLYIEFIITDTAAASSKCNDFGNWNFLKTRVLTVKNGSGKKLGSNRKGTFVFGIDSSIYNAFRAAGYQWASYIAYNQCAIGIEVPNLPSNQSIYVANLAGIGTYKFTRAQVAVNFLNGESSFEEFLN